jgi:hypothetical protein
VIAGCRLILVSSVGECAGMGLELTRDDGARVAEVFEDDESGSRTVSLYEDCVPLAAVEWLLAEARTRL